MNKMLAKKLNVFVIIYLNNILIYINKEDYIDSIQWDTKQLRKHLLYISLKKCEFHLDEL